MEMQQPMAQQHEQIGGQQAVAQQMVLCPVRFVYETQILVQPGDQIQPNQTFFINPQNPPPWMQNSLQPRQTVTNSPVVYVQQLPSNIVPSVQQPIEQNQLYVQPNFANFQLQQQMLAQASQDIRASMQLANIVPNMFQNLQTVPNERTITQNGQMQNPQIIQNQINVNRPMQNQVINQPPEVQRQVYMRPQMPQQTNVQRPMMSVNHMQNMQHQPMNNAPNVQANVGQNYMPNVGRAPPNMTNSRPQTPNNVVNVQPIPKIRELAPTEMNKPANNPVGNVVPNVRSFVPNHYRPIQPRPQMSNMPKPQPHIPVQTVQCPPVYSNDKPPQNGSNNFAIIQQLNNPINRKRKSESPDEIHKKLTSNNSPKPNFNPQQNIIRPNASPAITVTKIVNEMGTNTSPVHRPRLMPQYQNNQNNMNNNMSNQNNINNNMNNQNNINTNMNNQNNINNMNKNIDNNTENIARENPLPQEKDKLLRNTVYTQARGRFHQEKMEELRPVQNVNPEPVKILRIEEIKRPEVPLNIEPIPKTIETPKHIQVNLQYIQENIKNIQENAKIDQDYEESHSLIITDINDKVVKRIEMVDERRPDVDTHKEENMAVSGLVNEEVEVDNRLVISQDVNILTHVVDGYVIQESNIAFPIRKPLKEKSLPSNMKSGKSEERDLVRESIKEELKNNLDIPLLPFHYLLLDSSKEEEKKEEEMETTEVETRETENAEVETTEERTMEVETPKVQEIEKEKDDPFSKLEHNTVKSWTVEDLTSYLMKFNWKETVSLLQDHEIDGESLYLVSKQQLLTIGVSEEHADVICEFVKS